MHRFNLFVVSNPQNQHISDFERIVEQVERLDPQIRARHLTTDRRGRGPRWASLLRPTLTVAINEPFRFRPLRGAVAAHGGGGKIAKFRQLDAAGLPLPRWQVVEPGCQLDVGEWGPYVVEKPSRGRRGAYVRLRRTGKVRYQPPESYPEDHPGRQGPMLAQRFIFTGPQPISYRVLTCFGEVVMAVRYENTQARPMDPLEPARGGGGSVVASARGGRIALCDEPDVLALGQASHAAFPDEPLIGADIMREAETGKLWLAEVNSGHVWTLSNPNGLSAQAEFGLDFYGQFDGLRQAAKGMAAATRRLAR